MLYLVRHPIHRHGQVSVFSTKGCSWHFYISEGIISPKVASMLVEAGVATWDDTKETQTSAEERTTCSS